MSVSFFVFWANSSSSKDFQTHPGNLRPQGSGYKQKEWWLFSSWMLYLDIMALTYPIKPWYGLKPPPHFEKKVGHFWGVTFRCSCYLIVVKVTCFIAFLAFLKSGSLFNSCTKSMASFTSFTFFLQQKIVVKVWDPVFVWAIVFPMFLSRNLGSVCVPIFVWLA